MDSASIFNFVFVVFVGPCVLLNKLLLCVPHVAFLSILPDFFLCSLGDIHTFQDHTQFL